MWRDLLTMYRLGVHAWKDPPFCQDMKFPAPAMPGQNMANVMTL
jgi:hypothetical protein